MQVYYKIELFIVGKTYTKGEGGEIIYTTKIPVVKDLIKYEKGNEFGDTKLQILSVSEREDKYIVLAI